MEEYEYYSLCIYLLFIFFQEKVCRVLEWWDWNDQLVQPPEVGSLDDADHYNNQWCLFYLNVLEGLTTMWPMSSVCLEWCLFSFVCLVSTIWRLSYWLSTVRYHCPWQFVIIENIQIYAIYTSVVDGVHCPLLCAFSGSLYWYCDLCHRLPKRWSTSSPKT